MKETIVLPLTDKHNEATVWRRRRLQRALLAAVAAAACSTDGISPAATTELTPVAEVASSSYDPATKTLGVGNLSSVSKFQTAGYYQLRANVVGGTGSFTYYWYAQYCYDTGCVDQIALAAPRSNGSSDTLTIYVPPDWTKVRLKVVVGDASSETWTGNSTQHVLGPLYASPLPTYYCIDGDDESIGFPFYTAAPPYPFNQTGYYRTDVCTFERIYQGS